MNEIQIFNYNSAQVRVIEQNGSPWWVLKDVRGILGIENHKDLPKRLDEDEVGRFELPHPQNPLKSVEMLCINESGLYSVILRSDKPEAKPFRKWVTSEVLPSIRKTGSYRTGAAAVKSYEKAAVVISKCPKDRLELVIDLYRKAGLDISKLTTQVEVESEKPEDDGVDLVELLSKFTLCELMRLLNLSKSTVYYYRTGKVRPREERRKFIIKTLEGK